VTAHLDKGGSYGAKQDVKTPPLPEGQLRPNRKQLGSKATGALEGCPEGTEGRELPKGRYPSVSKLTAPLNRGAAI